MSLEVALGFKDLHHFRKGSLFLFTVLDVIVHLPALLPCLP